MGGYDVNSEELQSFESRLGALSGRGGDLAVRGEARFTFSLPAPREEALEALEKIRASMPDLADWEVFFDEPSSTGFAYFTLVEGVANE